MSIQQVAVFSLLVIVDCSSSSDSAAVSGTAGSAATGSGASPAAGSGNAGLGSAATPPSAGARAPSTGAAGRGAPSGGPAGAGRGATAGAGNPTAGAAPTVDEADADGGVPDADGGRPRSISVTDQSAATKAWWSYDRPGKYTVVTSSVAVPMRDGVTLGCTLSRPALNGTAATGTFPGLVLEFTPYTLQMDSYTTEAGYFAKRGYNGLVCTIRGTGDSGGTWQHAFSSQDGRDAHDLVEWLATQPFSDGRIGQLGESYGGQTSYGAAVEQAPHLRAIAPMEPPANLYDDVNYPGGIEAEKDGDINNWPPIAELLSFGKISADDEYATNHAHPTYDAYWQERTLIGRHAQIQVPVLTTGGWLDGYFRSGAMSNIEGALDRTWAIYGPWPHLPNVDMDSCAIACVDDPLPGGVILAWMDYWVMDIKDAPIPTKPTFNSYENPKGASKGWRELSAWVPEGTDMVSYQLGSDGTIAETATATERVKFHEPSSSGTAFTSAPLAEDRVLIGRALLDLRASSSASDATFYVQLFDVDSSDKETFVNDGFLKTSHRNSHTNPEPVPVDQAIDYHIVIRPQHYRFAAGHRVRIRISSGVAATLVQPAAADVTLETGAAATLRLPNFGAAAD